MQVRTILVYVCNKYALYTYRAAYTHVSKYKRMLTLLAHARLIIIAGTKYSEISKSLMFTEFRTLKHSERAHTCVEFHT